MSDNITSVSGSNIEGINRPDIIKMHSQEKEESPTSQQLLTEQEKIKQEIERVDDQLKKLESKNKRKPHGISVIEFNMSNERKIKELQKEKRSLEKQRDIKQYSAKLAEFYEEIENIAKGLPQYSEGDFPEQEFSSDNDHSEEETSDDSLVPTQTRNADHMAKEELIAFGKTVWTKFPWDKYSERLKYCLDDEADNGDDEHIEFFNSVYDYFIAEKQEIMKRVNNFGQLYDGQWKTYYREDDTNNSERIHVPPDYPDRATPINVLFRIKELNSKHFGGETINCIDVPWEQDRYDLAYKGFVACMQLVEMFKSALDLIKRYEGE